MESFKYVVRRASLAVANCRSPKSNGTVSIVKY